MSDNHPIHYYEDGDIFLISERKKFLVHKIVLSLSSEFFKDLFKLSKPSTNENVKLVESQPHPIIEMNGETSKSVETMLSFIYPSSYIKITFDNVEELLRLADKFIIINITKCCSDFLLQNFQQNIFLTFRIADKYSLAEAFKESSKLVLDDLEKYRQDSDYDQLSEKARLKLMDSWYNYIAFYSKLIQENKSKSIRYGHNYTDFRKYLTDKSDAIILNPSKLIKLIKTDINLEFLKRDIENLTKNYEPLSDNTFNENLYIYAELN